MAAAYRCDKCGFVSFKTEQSFQGHLLTKKHLMRQENVRQDLYQCKTCNKWYCGRSGISHHNKTCSSKNLNPKKEHDEMKAQLATRIEERANNMINREIVDTTRQNIIVHPPTQLKRKDKRRSKVNMVLRQQIVDRQENTCGYCEQILSSYFQIDHIVGLQFGGDNEESNLMALCCECHSKKSITENRCRKQIKEAVQTIIIRNFPVRPPSQIHQYELIEMGS